jgi:hypothetical protein
MKTFPRSLFRIRPGLLALVAAVTLGQVEASSVRLWDTGKPLDAGYNEVQWTGWKAVTSEQFDVEPDPAKAASDPGYYGREYEFKGDAVIENGKIIVVFNSGTGLVQVYDRSPAGGHAVPGEAARLNLGRWHATPSVIRSANDEVLLRLSLLDGGSVLFAVDRSEIVSIQPEGPVSGLQISLPLAYAVIPGFVADDLIFAPSHWSGGFPLHLPVEQMFVGLLQGEGSQVVFTWPEGRQSLRLRPPDGDGRVSLEFQPDGKALYLGVQIAPGIWHREPLVRSFLEKDAALESWKPPFAAKWKTQLEEAGVRTTFAFRDSKDQIWRGVAGSYTYPVWIEDGQAYYHLSKKIPPRGESIIYHLEGNGTPEGISTPVDMLKASLGRSASDAIRDLPGRKLRTHHRRAGGDVHRACTCGYTEAIQALFEAGLEVENRDIIAASVADMNFFVEQHVARIDEHRDFAQELEKMLDHPSSGATQPLREALLPLVRKIPEECRVQADNMKSAEHAAELTRRTLALTEKQSPDNLKAYMDLLDAWRAMGGAQDYVLALCHMVARDVFQQAGYGAVANPESVELAHRVRERCRQVLRNADGYEIWADY